MVTTTHEISKPYRQYPISVFGVPSRRSTSPSNHRRKRACFDLRSPVLAQDQHPWQSRPNPTAAYQAGEEPTTKTGPVEPDTSSGSDEPFQDSYYTEEYRQDQYEDVVYDYDYDDYYDDYASGYYVVPDTIRRRHTVSLSIPAKPRQLTSGVPAVPYPLPVPTPEISVSLRQFHCKKCKLSFSSNKKLHQHLRESVCASFVTPTLRF